jgi:predicted RNA-binding protein with PUA-like domain
VWGKVAVVAVNAIAVIAADAIVAVNEFLIVLLYTASPLSNEVFNRLYYKVFSKRLFMNYWLMKSEPSVFSIDDLQSKPNQTYCWDGVRNYQARNMMRDDMKNGDVAFFYHSNCAEPGIVGIMEVVKESYPDFSAFDPSGHYFDPKSNPNNLRWFMVDLKFVRKLSRTITLKELKEMPELVDLALVRRGNRLSIMPISSGQWDFILGLETT